MQIHELKPNKGAKTRKHRVGRGPGSGSGRTAGKGEKGQKARSGGVKGGGFEGGQTPWYRRLPKLKGFKNFLFKKEFQEVSLTKLDTFDNGTEVTPLLLAEKHLIHKALNPVKILGSGELTKKLVVKAHAFSKSAEEKIIKSGGQIQLIPPPNRLQKKPRARKTVAN